MISLNEWELWHISRCCHVIYTGYDVVNYSGNDLRNTVGAYHQDSGCNDTDTMDTMSNVVGVMT